MATVNPYLIFNGDCEAAFLFYQSVFGVNFHIWENSTTCRQRKVANPFQKKTPTE